MLKVATFEYFVGLTTKIVLGLVQCEHTITDPWLLYGLCLHYIAYDSPMILAPAVSSYLYPFFRRETLLPRIITLTMHHFIVCDGIREMDAFCTDARLIGVTLWNDYTRQETAGRDCLKINNNELEFALTILKNTKNKRILCEQLQWTSCECGKISWTKWMPLLLHDIITWSHLIDQTIRPRDITDPRDGWAILQTLRNPFYDRSSASTVTKQQGVVRWRSHWPRAKSYRVVLLKQVTDWEKMSIWKGLGWISVPRG